MLDLKAFKKISEDENTATLQHSLGHKIHIVKAVLSPKILTQLKSLPLHQAEGSKEPVQDPNAVEDTSQNAPAMQHHGAVVNINVGQPPAAQQVGATDTSGGTPTAPPTVPPPAPAAQQVGAPDTSGGTPSAPPTVPPPAPAFDPDAGLKALQGYSEGVAGLKGQSQALVQEGQDKQQLLNDSADAEKRHAKALQDDLAAKSQEIDAITKDIAANHINPNHYMESKDTPAKISTAIGLLLGGIAAGKNGGPNPAMQFLNSQIERDLASQQVNLGTKKGLLAALQNQYQDKVVSENMFRVIRANTLAQQLQAVAATSQSAQAKAALDLGMSQLKQQYAPLLLQSAWRSVAQQAAQGGGGGVDPAVLVRHLVPEPLQKAAFEEVKNAQNVTQNGPKILEAFDKAAKENTVWRRAGGLLPEPASVRALHQLMLPNFKSIDGTVRQAQMEESFNNLTPNIWPLGKSGRDATKREALVDWLHSEAAAPTTKGYDIDLGGFDKTSGETLPAKSNSKVQAFMRANPAVKTQEQAIKILKNAGKL